MREATGTTISFQLILSFTLILTAFLALTITYNRVFKLKNETLSILEKYEGTNDIAIKTINNYLSSSGYQSTGICPSGEFGVKDISSNIKEKSNGKTKYYYCLSSEDVQKQPTKRIYKVTLFYKFNLPIIGDLTNFKVTGKTKNIIGTKANKLG